MNVKKKFQILAGVIALIGMLAILFVCIRKYMPSSQRMSSEEYFGQLGETEAGHCSGGSHCAGARADL